MRCSVSILVPLLALVAGCGTIANFNGGRGILHAPSESETDRPPLVYGGVLWDLESFTEKPFDPGLRLSRLPFFLVELGLSASLDTLTLPLVIGINLKLAYQRAMGTYPTRPDPVFGLPPADADLPLPERKITEPTPAETIVTPR